jgi:hypothetical protein
MSLLQSFENMDAIESIIISALRAYFVKIEKAGLINIKPLLCLSPTAAFQTNPVYPD